MEKIGALVSQVSQRWQLRAGRVLRPLGLTYAQFQLLAALAEVPGVTQAHVARQAGIDAMTASVALRSLDRRGLVSRRVSATDSRARLLTLTARGAAVVERAVGLVAAAEEQFFTSVGAARAEFAAVLAALLGQRARVRVAMGRAG